MKKIIAMILLIVSTLLITSCGKTWTCDECGRTWNGKAYYGYFTTETFCEDCAKTYWMPLPYQNYVKK